MKQQEAYMDIYVASGLFIYIPKNIRELISITFLEAPSLLDPVEEGGIVTNRFSGKNYELTLKELSMYNFIKKMESLVQKLSMNRRIRFEFKTYISGYNKDVQGKYGVVPTDLYLMTPESIIRDGIEWFEKTNPEACKILFEA